MTGMNEFDPRKHPRATNGEFTNKTYDDATVSLGLDARPRVTLRIQHETWKDDNAIPTGEVTELDITDMASGVDVDAIVALDGDYNACESVYWQFVQRGRAEAPAGPFTASVDGADAYVAWVEQNPSAIFDEYDILAAGELVLSHANGDFDASTSGFERMYVSRDSDDRIRHEVGADFEFGMVAGLSGATDLDAWTAENQENLKAAIADVTGATVDLDGLGAAGTAELRFDITPPFGAYANTSIALSAAATDQRISRLAAMGGDELAKRVHLAFLARQYGITGGAS